MKHIFIINLLQDEKKKTHMQMLAAQQGLKVEFIEATNGALLDSETINDIYSPRKAIDCIGRELSKGEIGCFLSHQKIFQRIMDENIEEAVIMEDDVYFDAGLLTFINNRDQLPNDTELVLLGYWQKGVNDMKKLISYRYAKVLTSQYRIVRFCTHVHGTYGYYITRKGAGKLLKSFESGIVMPIDHYVCDDNYVNLYGLFPPVVHIEKQFDVEKSDLEAERRKMRKDTHNIFENNALIWNFEIVQKFYFSLKRRYKQIKSLKEYS